MVVFASGELNKMHGNGNFVGSFQHTLFSLSTM